LGVASRIHLLLVGRQWANRSRRRPTAEEATRGTQIRRRAGWPARAATLPAPRTERQRSPALSASDPNYNPDTDTYRQIYRGHDNASAVTNSEGLTVYFDPDTHEVLGFAIVNFSAFYEAHKTPEGEFEVSLPKRVPANLEEEMDFDAEALKSGVRIAEFY
jgi:hypothetical protein